MTNKLKQILDNYNRYYVLGISSTNNVTGYQLIQVLYKGDELKIEKRFFSNSFDDEFKKHLKKDFPLLLHLEGGNIINKVVENKTGYRKSIIFKADPNDFHFFEYHQKDKVFVSVIRKQAVEDAIKLLKDIGVYTVDISFGPFIMSSLIPIIKGDSHISSSNYSIQIKEDEIVSFKTNPNNQKQFIINGETLNEKEVPLMAAFLNYKYPNDTIDFDNAFLNNNKSEFKYKKWFKMASVFTLFFTLLSLLISHTLLNSYLNTLAEKESTYSLSKQTLLKFNTLNEEKNLKEKILETSGASLKRFIAKYVSEIGNSVPNDITLNTVHNIPAIKKVKPFEKINFDFSVISVSGESTNDNAFNNWVKNIKTYSWVDKLEIIDYSEEGKNLNSFLIKIKI